MNSSNPVSQSRKSSQFPTGGEQSIAQAGYLRPEDVTEDRLLRIADWQFQCAWTSSDAYVRVVIKFEDEEKALALEGTNGRRLADYFGCTNLDHWIGQLVRLSVVTTPRGPAIRVDAATDNTQHGELEVFELN